MKSFFEKLTGAVNMEDQIDITGSPREKEKKLNIEFFDENIHSDISMDNENNEPVGELTVDMHQTPDEIVIKTIVAGVKPDDLDVAITRDTVTIRGKREESKIIDENDYVLRELYWGSFARKISLPTEINVEEADATEQHGVLTLKLPKIDKDRQTKLKVKSK